MIHNSQSVRSGRGRRVILTLSLLLIFVLASTSSGVAKSRAAFPEVIPLPLGFAPEGIAIGRGTDFFVGNLYTGKIFKGNLRTGEGAVLVEDPAVGFALGLKLDKRTNFLFVAGGFFGSAAVYDGATGEALGVYQLASGTDPTFINDVVLTREAAYFTDSFRPALYRLPLGPGGELPDPSAAETIPLGPGFDFELIPIPDPPFFIPNGNGIAATKDGKFLLVMNLLFGEVYRVDPQTGEAVKVDLGGPGMLANGDGLLLVGKNLYVVQNFANQIGVVRLDPGFTSGKVGTPITSPYFRVPTTIARLGKWLFAVNARFDVPPEPTTEYEVVRVPAK